MNWIESYFAISYAYMRNKEIACRLLTWYTFKQSNRVTGWQTSILTQNGGGANEQQSF